ncbi:Rha family transcriptional regulator [Paenibacillus kandeliae]|uniref:Rha family transcriptional regulator n=1 Tax=Paenibacillus kandeliae TaxID=3231269 RepID=UPI00345A5532
MNQLTLVQTNSGLFAASRQVAEMIDVRHADLIRSIAGYIHILENAKLRYQDFFEADSYKVSGNNKNYTRYLLTRKGCDMVANKMTGERGVLFTAGCVRC